MKFFGDAVPQVATVEKKNHSANILPASESHEDDT